MSNQAPFRYDVVGSFLRPEYLKDARAKFAEGKITEEQLKETEDKAIKELVEKEKEVGLQAVTDGEFRRRYWHLDFLADLEVYPYLSFEQGDYNSFYFSEEILSTLDRNKNIKVRDRATLFNLAVGLDGYTVSSGVISKELNGENIIGKPLLVDEYMRIGTIVRKDVALSRYGKVYMEALKKYTGGM